MEPEQNHVDETHEAATKSRLHEVTSLSKYLALALFVALPFLGAYVGYQFVPIKVIEIDRTETVRDLAVKSAPDNAGTEMSNKENSTTEFAYAYVSSKQGDYTFLREEDDLLIFHPLPFESGIRQYRFNNAFAGGRYTVVEPHYIKNADTVIFTGFGFHAPRMLESADAASFSVVTASDEDVSWQSFARDKDSLFHWGHFLEDIDPENVTFIQSDGSYKLPIVRDTDTIWYPMGNCSGASYERGSLNDLSTYTFPCLGGAPIL